MYDSDRNTRSFGALFSQLAADIGLLMQQEAQLAKGEFKEMLVKLLIGLGVLAVGGLIAMVGLVALLCAVVLALALVMPHWAATLVVGLLFLVVGGLSMMFGVQRMRDFKLVPERTLTSLKQTLAMVRERLS
jgi:predicted membrane metal-binding protein